MSLGERMQKDLICSFCGKQEQDVKRLIASPSGESFICDECIDVCKEIMKDEKVVSPQTKIDLPECLQTTALGASYLAGLSSGYYQNLDHIKKIHRCQKIFEPKMNKSEVKDRYKGWKKAVEVTRMFK